ncbi:alpha/beta fold hydrolase [Mangrovimonas spongiae]|uniref:Alpha/beta hydrolase n=1 Tax=Mangrovimonas spongiae TaxID=2494697 RepID=A0A3R9MVP6_9FLAO|nr:alpha/beta hydrolase [Mangrovimonas spongiae]RSK41889.1 alpha/beta hydrolase [Mangrovimonas spongiae]
MPKEINKQPISLDYSNTGHGDNVLLLLHGLGSTKQDWKFQIPAFSKEYRVIAPDLRGHGKSFHENLAYGVAFMVQDVVNLLKQLQIKKVTPIGFSMGGAVAYQLAYDYPELIDKLIIVNSGPDFNGLGKIGEDLLTNRTEFLKTKGLEALAKEVAYNMFPEPGQEALRSEFETRCAANNYNAYYQSFVTLMDWGLGDKLKTIKAKTLVVASDMDYTPVDFKKGYVERMHDAQLQVVKNSRHGVVLDQPEAFNNIVLQFLKNE